MKERLEVNIPRVKGFVKVQLIDENKNIVFEKSGENYQTDQLNNFITRYAHHYLAQHSQLSSSMLGSISFMSGNTRRTDTDMMHKENRYVYLVKRAGSLTSGVPFFPKGSSDTVVGCIDKFEQLPSIGSTYYDYQGVMNESESSSTADTITMVYDFPTNAANDVGGFDTIVHSRLDFPCAFTPATTEGADSFVKKEPLYNNGVALTFIADKSADFMLTEFNGVSMYYLTDEATITVTNLTTGVAADIDITGYELGTGSATMLAYGADSVENIFAAYEGTTLYFTTYYNDSPPVLSSNTATLFSAKHMQIHMRHLAASAYVYVSDASKIYRYHKDGTLDGYVNKTMVNGAFFILKDDSNIDWVYFPGYAKRINIANLDFSAHTNIDASVNYVDHKYGIQYPVAGYSDVLNKSNGSFAYCYQRSCSNSIGDSGAPSSNLSCYSRYPEDTSANLPYNPFDSFVYDIGSTVVKTALMTLKITYTWTFV